MIGFLPLPSNLAFLDYTVLVLNLKVSSDAHLCCNVFSHLRHFPFFSPSKWLDPLETMHSPPLKCLPCITLPLPPPQQLVSLSAAAVFPPISQSKSKQVHNHNHTCNWYENQYCSFLCCTKSYNPKSLHHKVQLVGFGFQTLKIHLHCAHQFYQFFGHYNLYHCNFSSIWQTSLCCF